MDRKRILLIEDHHGLRKLLSSYLGRSYNVNSFEDALKALKWLSLGNLPDLIVLDMSIPQINGIEFLSQIRCSGFYRDIPAIVISGEECQETVNQCKILGIEAYLFKPFNPLELDKIIENTLRPKNSTVTV